MGFFSRKPEVQDEAFKDLAEMFFNLPDDPTPGSENLDRNAFDFSVESLAIVDDYLEMVRGRDFDNRALTKVILRSGAYVGEVIRGHINTYHWLDYKEASRLSSQIMMFGEGIGTAGILWDGKSGFSFPLAKVMKFLENGREDNVKFLAQAIIIRAKRNP